MAIHKAVAIIKYDMVKTVLMECSFLLISLKMSVYKMKMAEN